MSNYKKIAKAVIPAAGLGTRMLPATKALPKEMLPVAGKPLIQYAVEEAAASGIDTVILVIRGNKSLIQDHFAPDHATGKDHKGGRRWLETPHHLGDSPADRYPRSLGQEAAAIANAHLPRTKSLRNFQERDQPFLR